MGRNMKGVPQEGGLTLVELMVTIAVAIILLSIALPQFSTIIINNRVKSAAARLVQDLQWARAEAVKTNRAVTVTASGSSIPPTCQWSANALTESRSMNHATFVREFPQVSCQSSVQAALCFSPIGNLQAGNNCKFGAAFTFSAPQSGATNTWLVMVSAGGRILSCLQGSTPGQCR
ncbi:pilus assembly FimT family protein [Acidithiobacillus sulfuriphilus]|uniref:pilus assembly FimT family protein n=1 Tax=Acidithiobacillus sulfuriphilus TaxID=1867749 RepID=UPI003F6281EB